MRGKKNFDSPSRLQSFFPLQAGGMPRSVLSYRSTALLAPSFCVFFSPFFGSSSASKPSKTTAAARFCCCDAAILQSIFIGTILNISLFYSLRVKISVYIWICYQRAKERQISQRRLFFVPRTHGTKVSEIDLNCLHQAGLMLTSFQTFLITRNRSGPSQVKDDRRDMKYVKTLSVCLKGKLLSYPNADQESENQTDFHSFLYNRSKCCVV